MAASILPQRIAGLLLSGLGLFALAIALIGLYGLIAFAVVQRAQEFGVRMALGASAHDVRRLVTTHPLRLVGSGICCVVPAAVAVALLMRRFLKW